MKRSRRTARTYMDTPKLRINASTTKRQRNDKKEEGLSYMISDIITNDSPKVSHEQTLPFSIDEDEDTDIIPFSIDEDENTDMISFSIDEDEDTDMIPFTIDEDGNTDVFPFLIDEEDLPTSVCIIYNIYIRLYNLKLLICYLFIIII